MNPEKPAYRVPSMAEIEALRWNGFTVVSTFSGCGGSCLGYRMAGFRVVWANEFVPAAQDTYKANHKGTILDTRDIRKVKPEDVLKATGLKVGAIDLFDGSPPCASFSTAGKREAHWGKAKKYSDKVQRTDDLFFEYVRLLRGLQPKTFIAENVSGLVKGVAKGYFLEVLAAMKACGYRVAASVVDAQWLGVPQARCRTIFFGVREDLDGDPVFPNPLPFRYSMKEAIGSLNFATVKGGTGGAFDSKDATFPTDRPCPTVLATKQNQFEVVSKVAYGGIDTIQSVNIDDSAPTVMAGGIGGQNHQQTGVVGGEGIWTPEGRAYDPETATRIDLQGTSLAKEFVKAKAGKEHRFFNLAVAKEKEPIPTITASGGGRGTAGVTHCTPRKFTLIELRRICSFPDDFVLTGSYTQRWERLGRSVPPVMMMHLAANVRDRILRKNRKQTKP